VSLTDRTIFATDAAQVGIFRCSVDDPRFSNTGPVENHVVVFPRTGVWIRHAGSRPFIADPGVITIYNRGQEYERRPLCPDGDRSDWYAVSPESALALAREIDPALGDDPARPFQAEYVASSVRLYTRQRRFFLRVKARVIDALEGEETILDIVAQAVRAAHSAAKPPVASKRAAEAHRDLALRARAELARDVAGDTTVSELAKRLDVSSYHLCRVFKVQTGTTLHAYRLDLRLRLALERLEACPRSCSALAHELGFSSHSHFTGVFRRRLGFTPSAARQLLAPSAALPRGLLEGVSGVERARRNDPITGSGHGYERTGRRTTSPRSSRHPHCAPSVAARAGRQAEST
jgi:AraC family transcriptional regulator